MAGVSHVYAGAVRSIEGGRGGVFRQAAGEARWEALTDGLPDGTEVHAITVHRDDPAVVFPRASFETRPCGAPSG